MLTQLCKRAWFCCLMICVISWSGVSSMMAQAMPMMQPNATADDVMALHCQQHQQMMWSESDAIHASTALPHVSHCDLADLERSALTSSEGSCIDCQMSLCQTAMACLTLNDFELCMTPTATAMHPPRFDYRAQHLIGFWQQILRPPKA